MGGHNYKNLQRLRRVCVHIPGLLCCRLHLAPELLPEGAAEPDPGAVQRAVDQAEPAPPGRLRLQVLLRAALPAQPAAHAVRASLASLSRGRSMQVLVKGETLLEWPALNCPNFTEPCKMNKMHLRHKKGRTPSQEVGLEPRLLGPLTFMSTR